MDLKRDIIPVTELKNHTKEVLERVVKTGGPILVTQKGRSIVLIMDVEAFQKREKKLRLLEEIARGERELLEGKGLSHAEIKTRVSRWSAGGK